MSTVAAETTAPPAQASNTGFVKATSLLARATVGSLVATRTFAYAIGLRPCSQPLGPLTTNR